MLETLSLHNMDIFKRLYEESKLERSYDKDFFSTYNKENFLMRYIHRKFVKLLEHEGSFIGFIWYEASNEKFIKVLSLYINKNYINLIRETNVLKELNNNVLCYEEYKDKREVLELLGFESIMTTFMMKLNLNNIKLNLLDENLITENLEVRKFLIGKDEELRCILQNDIFYDEDRKPLMIEDIYSDMIQDYYLKNNCYFLIKDNEYIGYGQIILNRGFYTLVNFGILEEYRGIGFGTRFIRYIIDLCIKDNIYDLYIRVDEKNIKAINLYKKIGFNVIDEVLIWQRD